MQHSFLTTYIKKPCTEVWGTMKKTNGGRHCSKCDHVVIDFTKMSEEEFSATIEASKGKRICGRFEEHQLNQSLRWKALRRNPFYRLKQFALSSAALLLLQLSATNAVASEPKATFIELPVIQDGEVESDSVVIVLRDSNDKRIYQDVAVKVISNKKEKRLLAKNGILKIPKTSLVHSDAFTLRIISQRIKTSHHRSYKTIRIIPKQEFELQTNAPTVLHILSTK